MIKQVLQFILLLALCTPMVAQQVEQGPPAPQAEPATITVQKAGENTNTASVPEHRTCGTMSRDSVRRAQNAEMPSLQEFEQWLQVKMAQESNQNNGVQSIPIVVHVIHDGESQGNGSNISQAQVESQIDVLNEDFRRLNSDTSNTPAQWQGIAADPEIEFCLATVDEQGNSMAEAGINRVNRNTEGFNAPPYTTNYIDNVIKPATIWDPTEYCNIWVLNLGGSILGYAQLPSQSGLPGLPGISDPNTDGIVISFQYFGRGGFSQLQPPYDLGRTATHEMGHWLGLRHIWGDGGCSAGDFCGDTPDSDGPNYGCQSGTMSCGSQDMVENYMDYSDDACFNLFTEDQKARMKTVLNNSPRRTELTNSLVCNPNVPPVADFSGTPTTIYAGGTVTFTDESSNNPTSWDWTFQGSVEGSSTVQNPTIEYQTPGTYPVTLVVSNGNGSDTENKQAYIEVLPATNCDTLNLPPANDLAILGYQGEPLVGFNSGLATKSHAQYFDNAQTFNYVTGSIFYFGLANKTAGSNASVTFKIWDDNGPNNSPGTVLDSSNRDLAEIEAVVDGGFFYQMFFDEPVDFSGNFYLGFSTNNFVQGDTLALVSGDQGTGPEGYAWQEFTTSLEWVPMDSIWSFGSDPAAFNLFISPYVAQEVPHSNFSVSETTVCQGEQVTFDASSSTNAINYAWLTPGGTPYNPVGSQNDITYDTAGTHSVLLRTYGVCGAIDDSISEDLMTVHPNPRIDSFTTAPAACGQTNGTAEAHVSGGTTPYTYQWGSEAGNQSGVTATGLEEGSYYLYLTDDAGCTDVEIADVGSAGGPSGDVDNVVDVTCPEGTDGEATVTATEGTPPYSYEWSNGATGAAQTGLAGATYTVTVTDDNDCEDEITVTVEAPDTIAFNADVDNESCLGGDGAITLNVIGGTPGYDYDWSTGETGNAISSLSSGTYMVTVTDDNGCTKSGQIDVGGFEPIVTTTTSAADATCLNNDGVASISITSGGSAPFTFAWPNGEDSSTAVELSQGSHIVTITDDNNCEVTDTVEVGFTNNQSASVTADQDICEGESVDLTATGGNSYEWSTGEQSATISVDPVQTTTYDVTITLGVCADTLDTEVTVQPALTTSITDDQEICEGEEVTLTASGGADYEWSNSEQTASIAVSPMQTTTYDVTITDGECSEELSTEVTVNPLPSTAIDQSDTMSVCKEEEFTLSASGADNFEWGNGETTASINVTEASSGEYTYTVTGTTDGCSTSDSITITVEVCSGIDDPSFAQSLQVYPNPATNTLNVEVEELGSDKLHVEMYTITGQQVYQSTRYAAGSYNIDVSHLAAGMYHLKLRTNEGEVTRKVTITR